MDVMQQAVVHMQQATLLDTQLQSVRISDFTAFAHLDLQFSPGLNVFVGPNATGKTHLLKLLYCAAAVSKLDVDFADKLINAFQPHERRIGRLVRRQQGSAECHTSVQRRGSRLTIRFSNHTQPTSHTQPVVTGSQKWRETPIDSAYIPVREMLSNGAQLIALYRTRELDVEEVHIDIIERALLPLARGAPDRQRQRLLEQLRREMAGKIEVVDGRFFHRSPQGRLEFPLLAEGHRKLGLLWLLIQNRTLLEGSILFWDEPEANLNPSLIGCVVDVLLELQRLGVQVFISTHSYVTLKEVELRRRNADEILYLSFMRNTDASVSVEASQELEGLSANRILDTYLELAERDLRLSL